MSDPVDICNMALASLSVELIEGLTDTSLQAKLCDGLYPLCRDRLQATGYFDFVNQNLLLEDPAISPPDNWGYSHYFDLPLDTLRINSVSSAPETVRPTGWQQIGMVLATTFSPAYTNLALREEDSTVFPPLFVDALAALLSAELALALTKDQELYKLRHTMYVQKLSDAKGNDYGYRKRNDRSMSKIRASRFRGW